MPNKIETSMLYPVAGAGREYVTLRKRKLWDNYTRYKARAVFVQTPDGVVWEWGKWKHPAYPSMEAFWSGELVKDRRVVIKERHDPN